SRNRRDWLVPGRTRRRSRAHAARRLGPEADDGYRVGASDERARKALPRRCARPARARPAAVAARGLGGLIFVFTPQEGSLQPGRRNGDTYSGAPVISDVLFKGALIRECKRADRSGQPFALVLVSLIAPAETDSTTIWRATAVTLSTTSRATDILGWFKTNHTLGVILADSPAAPAALHHVVNRIRRELTHRLG